MCVEMVHSSVILPPDEGEANEILSVGMAITKNNHVAFSHLTIKSKTALAGHNLLAKLLIIA